MLRILQSLNFRPILQAGEAGLLATREALKAGEADGRSEFYFHSGRVVAGVIK